MSEKILCVAMKASLCFCSFLSLPSPAPTLADLVKLARLLLSSLATFCSGHLLAALVPKEAITTSIANLKDFGIKTVLRDVFGLVGVFFPLYYI